MKNIILSLVSLLILFTWYTVAVLKDVGDREKLYQLSLDYYHDICSQDEEACQELSPPTEYKMDTFGQMFYTMKTSHFNNMILIFVVFITIPGMYQFYKELKSGYIKNVIIRKKYSTYLKEQYKNALLRTIFIIPILFLLCFLVTFILCDGIVDINYTFTHAMPGISLPSLVYLEHPLLFSFVYLVNFVLLEILCLNIGFLCVKKAKNFVLAIIMSLLIYFLLNIVCSVLIGTILFELILGIENATTYVSFYNLISYEAPIYHATIFGLLYMVLFMIIIVFISTIILYFSYRNAEKVMIEIEK